jgi:hypothetical protein
MRNPSPLLILAAFTLAQLPNASAEVNGWVVVAATNGELPGFMARVVSEASRELERHGEHVWTAEGAATRFQRRGSAAAPRITAAAIEKWDRHSRDAIRALAKGDHAEALDRLDQAEALSRDATVELNRDPGRAQRVLDTCLYMLRARLETGDTEGAAVRAAQCVVLVPRGEPATLMHPPQVMSLYKQARKPGRAGVGTLEVASAPSGCGVRINGVRLGETPLEVAELPVGEYGVQVECEGALRGRVHATRVTAGTTRRFVDARFDRTVRTEPLLRLEYPRERRGNWRLSDAKEIAAVLPAHTVVVISAPSNDTVAVGLMDRTGSRQGCSRIPSPVEGPSSGALADAIHRLIEGRCGDLSASRHDPSSLFKPGI